MTSQLYPQIDAIGARHATTSAVAAQMASFWVRMVTSCMNIKRGLFFLHAYTHRFPQLAPKVNLRFATHSFFNR